MLVSEVRASLHSSLSHITEHTTDIVILQVMSLSHIVLMSTEHTGQALSRVILQQSSILVRHMLDIGQTVLTTHVARTLLVGSIATQDLHSYRVNIVNLQMFAASRTNIVNTFSPDFFGRFFIFEKKYDSLMRYSYFSICLLKKHQRNSSKSVQLSLQNSSQVQRNSSSSWLRLLQNDSSSHRVMMFWLCQLQNR